MVTIFERVHDHHGERYRAHRVAILQRRLGGARLFPAERQGGSGACPGDRHLADAAAYFPARHHSAQYPEIRRFERSHPATWAWKAKRSASRNSSTWARTSSAPSSPPFRARPVPLPYGGKFRQVMVDLNPGRSFIAKQLSPADVSNAFGLQNLILPAGTAKIGDRDYQIKLNSSPRDPGRYERPADQGGQRRHGLHARRRPGARRLRGADQHRAHQRHARRAADRDCATARLPRWRW